MRHGIMTVTEVQYTVFGTHHRESYWLVTQRYQARVTSNNETRRTMVHSLLAIQSIIDYWKGPIKLRIKREKA